MLIDIATIFINSIYDTTYIEDVCTDGKYLYCCCRSDGLRVYSFDGANFTYITNYTTGATFLRCYYDGSYVYTASAKTSGNNGTLDAFTFNGTTLTKKGTVGGTSGDVNFHSVYSDNTYIYTGGDYEDGSILKGDLRAYTFNGSSFTLKDTYKTGAPPSITDIRKSGSNIYCTKEYSVGSDVGKLSVYSFNGTTITLLRNLWSDYSTSIDDSQADYVYIDGDDVYPLGSGSGVYTGSATYYLGAYTFNGSNFSLSKYHDTNGISYTGMLRVNILGNQRMIIGNLKKRWQEVSKQRISSNTDAGVGYTQESTDTAHPENPGRIILLGTNLIVADLTKGLLAYGLSLVHQEHVTVNWQPGIK